MSIPAWLVTGHALGRAVLGDAARFSSVMPGQPASRGVLGSLLSSDPPEHDRVRRAVTREFTAARLRALQPWIDSIVDDRLAAMAAAGPPADIVRDFALPVPSLVICELLGVPYADRDEFTERATRQLDLTLAPHERQAAGDESRAYMAELVERARREPGADIIGTLVREHDTDLAPAELVGVASLLLVAGHETTANMLSLGLATLLEHPEQLAWLRADESRVPNAVEELLRHLAVVPVPVPRRATVDVELAGQRIAADELVYVSLPMASRDPELGPDLDRLDLSRAPTRHLAFGHGVHHCLGAALARLELRSGFARLLRRFPDLRATIPLAELDYRGQAVVFGPRALPVTW